MKHIIDIKTAMPTENSDGELTKLGMSVAHDYAKFWMQGKRNLDIERMYPELAGLFYDIRIDSKLAREHAIPLDK